MPVGLVKLFLIPAAIIAALVFLVVLGAIALWSALTVIAVITWVFRLPGRLLGRRRARRRARRGRDGSGEQPATVDDDLLAGHVAGEISGH